MSILLQVLIVLFTNSHAYNRPPAGTSAVPGMRNIFLDKTETTNGQWHFYLQELQKGADTSAYFSALPDTAVWHLSYDGHFSDPENYEDYPVVGISYEQAVSYCEWRSWYISSKEKRTVVFRLPELKVYERSQYGENDNSIAEGLYSTKLGFRTFLGLCDNASEMLSKEGTAIRGHESENCLETYEYYVPSHRLGFRCLAGFN